MPPAAWLTVESLVAHIPEVADLFIEIFDSKPAWIEPHYDILANYRGGMFGNQSPPMRTYGNFIDISGRLTKEDVAEFPGPLSDIAPLESGGSEHKFRVAVDHPGVPIWWDALPLHRSPFVPAAIIKPIFGTVDQYRAMCVVLLYALSIIVRYRPSVWRRVQEGDLDQMRVLIEAFLATVERILPHEFLGKITGQKIIVKEPGSF
jgi:YaaC-like Protein